MIILEILFVFCTQQTLKLTNYLISDFKLNPCFYTGKKGKQEDSISLEPMQNFINIAMIQ